MPQVTRSIGLRAPFSSSLRRPAPRERSARRALTHAVRAALLALFAFAFAGCALFHDPVPGKVPLYSAQAASGDLLAGAAAVDISPDGPVYMAGFKTNRVSEGVHDPLYARAIVLKRGELEVALVALDLVGVMRTEVEAIKARIEGISPRRVLIASTHDHHSPDTMGIWGVPPFKSGMDPKFMRKVSDGVVEAVRLARERLRPAEIASGSVSVDPFGLYRNVNRQGLVDPEIVVMHVRALGAADAPGSPDAKAGGATIATLVELGCHPEAVKYSNRLVSADFPHWTVTRLEAELGGVGVYVSGALGALVSPDRTNNTYTDPFRFDLAQKIGERLAGHAIDVVHGLGEYERAPRLAVWHTPLYLENENWRYDLMRWLGLVDRKVYGRNFFLSEVNLWEVGELSLATIPGELSPDLGLRIKSFCPGKRTLLVGLANDELGYMFPSIEYDMAYYDYERTLCIGRHAGERCVEGLRDLALMARYSAR